MIDDAEAVFVTDGSQHSWHLVNSAPVPSRVQPTHGYWARLDATSAGS